jgi:UDP-N-acetyl-D-mannosaminuronic acid dehydrogenase
VNQSGEFSRDVCVIGGGGHVGLPLALTFADTGLKTVVYDINTKVAESIRSGQMPFIEEGGQEMLTSVLERGLLEVETSPKLLAECKFLVLIVGTPVDEHLNPSFTAMHKALELCRDQLRDGQILILRSTVFPGISWHIQNFLIEELGKKIRVANCPERAVQGYSLREFRQNPQIISATDPQTLAEVRKLFGRFVPDFVEMEPGEAELCKLMCNAWRYVQFATVNQFYMIATQHGLNFDRILMGARHHYPRMAGMPGPGFAAGPCLVKDTMQLAAFSQNQFVLGHAAMLINEGLPAHVVQMARQIANLGEMTVGILGMAFKAESDDPRDSLSYKLRKLLILEARRVLCCDPYVDDPNLVPLERVLKESKFIFVGTPHAPYRGLKIPDGTYVIDVWNCVAR